MSSSRLLPRRRVSNRAARQAPAPSRSPSRVSSVARWTHRAPAAVRSSPLAWTGTRGLVVGGWLDAPLGFEPLHQERGLQRLAEGLQVGRLRNEVEGPV